MDGFREPAYALGVRGIFRVSRTALGWLLALLALTACGSGGYVSVGGSGSWGWYDWYDYYDPWGWDPYALTAGDFDDDDRLDVAVADREDGAVYLLRGTSDAKLEDASSAPFIGRTGPRWIDAGRFNGDRLRDLVLVGEDSSTVEVSLGDPSGGFLPAPRDAPLALRTGIRDVCVGDLDGDALTDLLVLDGAGTLRVFLSDGRGGFTAARGTVDLSEQMPDTRRGDVAIAAAAFDDRRGVDVAVVSASTNQVVLLSGRGDGTFTRGYVLPARVPATLLDVAACPCPDGPDLALLYRPADGRTAHVTRMLLHGDDAGTLTRSLDVGEATGLAAIDLDGDGLPDLLVVDPSTGALRIYRAERR